MGKEGHVTERTYKCLNPIGIQDPVDLHPLAHRLDRLEGKTIMFNMMVQVERELLVPLERMLKNDYPKVHWNMRASGPPISDEELGNADALIQGVAF
jgi:hypothetical protein